MFACGPAVGAGDTSQSGSGGASTSAETSPTPTTSGAESGAESLGSSTAGTREPACGNGIVEGDEGCDDGNPENADGCNTLCEVSGSIRWVEFLPGGFTVGLSAREGRAVAGIQQFDNGFEPTVALAGRDSLGSSFGDYLDVGGLSDRDIAQAPIALLPDGRVALGYAAVGPRLGPVTRNFGVLDFEGNAIAAAIDDEQIGAQYFGTAYHPTGALVLRGAQVDGGQQLVLEQYSESAVLLGSFPLGLSVSENLPPRRGALPERHSSMALVFTTTAAGGIDLHSNPSFGGWYSNAVGSRERGAAISSFSEDTELRLWTGTEVVVFDALDHALERETLSLEGELLWADAQGLVVGLDREIVLYGSDGAERLSVGLPQIPDGEELRPQYVRPDPEHGGLFVLADAGIPADPSTAAQTAMFYVVR